MRFVTSIAAIACGCASACGFGISAATAQTASVKAIFERYNLLGTFAWDCSKPVSRNNVYYVHRLLDAGHVQRDQMSSSTTRDYLIVVDKAEARPNEISLSGMVTGRVGGRDLDNKPANGVWRIEPNRLLIWEATVDGRNTIAGGRVLSNGSQVP